MFVGGSGGQSFRHTGVRQLAASRLRCALRPRLFQGWLIQQCGTTPSGVSHGIERLAIGVGSCLWLFQVA